MTAPVIRQFTGTIPDKGQSQTAFDTNVDAFLDWQALQFAPDLVAFGTFANDTAAALVAANLPSLTGRALDAVRVNAAADDVEFANVTAAGWALLNASGSAPMYAARAWVNFSGTGTPSIRAGGNVSSITDNGPGDYTVNFATAMQDHYYSAQVTMDHPDSNRYFYQPTRITKTASSYRFKQTYDGGAAGEGRDSESSNVTILR